MRVIKNILTMVLLTALVGCAKDNTSSETAPKAGSTPSAQGDQAGTTGAQAGNTNTATGGAGQAQAGGAAAGQAGGATGGAAAGGTAQAAAGDPAAEAKQIYAIRCAVCHGQAGRGDGAGAASLNPKPRDYGDKAWQASVKDEEIAKVIVEGGAAVGKSVLMAPNPDLGQKPEVLAEMVKLIRSFAQQ